MKASKKLLAFLLCAFLTVPALASCDSGDQPSNDTTAGESNTPPSGESDDGGTKDPSKMTDAEYFATYFVPSLRFTVASDVHIDDSNSDQEEARLAKLFADSYKYAEGHASYKKLDAVLFAGDVTNHGRLSQMQKFKSIMDGAIKEGTKPLLIMGNHEFYDNAGQAESRFEQTFGEVDGHEIIGGFHFIRISPDGDGNGFSQAKRDWLKAELEKAAKDDATKPIFVIQHQHVSNTVLGSEDWGTSDLTVELMKYPQIVHFSGHSHFPITDPRSVYQGSFTTFGTGGLSYTEMGLVGVESDGVFPTDTPGDYVTGGPTGNRDLAQYYIVEVDKNGSVQVIGYDMLTEKEVVRYYVRTPADKKSFTYKDGYASELEITFAENARFDISDTTEKSAVLTFSAAGTPTSYHIQHYRIEVELGNTTVLTKYVLAFNHQGVMPTEYTVKLTGLKGGNEYTAYVIPVDAYGNGSDDYKSVTFSTAASTYDPMKDGPDVFDLVFKDGAAYNGATNEKLESFKKPEIIYDDLIDMDVVSVANGSALKWDGYSEHYSELSNSITMTTFVLLPEKPTPTYWDIFGNMQSGGAGFEVTPQGKLETYLMIGGSYKFPTTDMVFGEYVHLAMTYDGTTVKVYVNGELKAEESAAGGIQWPADSISHFLVVGGDSGPDGGAEACMNGSIAHASVYSYALTEDQIEQVYLAQSGLAG